MIKVEVKTTGPVLENLNLITVTDGTETDEFHVDHADVETAKSEGISSVLDLVVLNGTSDMLVEAFRKGIPVLVDGEQAGQDILRAALSADLSPTP